MVAQTRTKPLAWAALLWTAGVLTACCVHGQVPSGFGSLTGRLTDTLSSPLENVTITVRNETIGSEERATTSRGGKYSFAHLAAGEYTLIANGPQGSGHVEGSLISSGHETRVQAAVEFAVPKRNYVFVPEPDRGAGGQQSSEARSSMARLREWQLSRMMDAPKPGAPMPMGTVFAPEVLLALPLDSVKTGLSAVAEAHIPLPTSITDSAPMSGAANSASGAGAGIEQLAGEKLEPKSDLLVAEVHGVELVALPAPMLVGRNQPHAQIAAAVGRTERTAQTLDAAQTGSLPLQNRDWKAFLAGLPPGDDGDDRTVAGGGASPQISTDGASLQSAFGRQVRRQEEPAHAFSGGESGIRRLRPRDDPSNLLDAARSGPSIEVDTNRGSERLHGQTFVSRRQELWGAHNPFTQWVQETGPASGAAIPAFTAKPYSPADREDLWGAGIGGVLHRQHLFWFGALDGYQRNDPAVASVKHPADFFAQPANDQMQLLSAQLGLDGGDPVSAGASAYSKLLESLAGLLGPAPRASTQWIAFGRLDWVAGERHRFTVEASGANFDSPGGGFTRASETLGTHSFGSVHATEQWLLGRWERFVTPNLLMITQGSYGHDVQSAAAEKPSAFEQTLNVSAWGQLPQIVVDSGYGFTIGNPARFGRGHYPDEHLYEGQEQLDWVRGNLMLRSGVELRHNKDATSRLRNQTGTYYYSTVEGFASDALAFAAFGMNGQLNPMDQHNCDQRGKAWRDTAGVLHGLGYLPCYSYYSQTMGPSDWWLSTSDWAGYSTGQWQPTKRTAFTLAMRWEFEHLPQPIGFLDNPDLPLTERPAKLGSQWGPRAGFAWGPSESRWPVVRLGYGMYFSRTRNSVVESVLTQTGSLKGDLNFFMRPTDNLRGGGAPPFPYVLAGEPASAVKPGAIEFAPWFRNGQVHQGQVTFEEALPGRVHLEAGLMGSLGRRLPVTLDANIDPAANPKTITYAVIDGNGSGPIKASQITVPFFATWPSATSPTGFAGRLNRNYQQVSEIFSRANSTYEAAILRISRSARTLTFRSRYTYAHAMDWNPDESSQLGGPSVLDPMGFDQEYGTSSLDIRHSLATAVILQPKWKVKDAAGRLANGWLLSGVGYLHSGLPYTMRTAGSLAKEFDVNGTAIVALSTGMNGYGGDNRVYGIGRNTYRYPATWKLDLRLAKRFDLGQMRQLELMAESFNLFNHQNVTELETVGYSIEPGTVNGAMPRLNFLTGLKSGQTEFGRPLNINATDSYRERQMQFGARIRF